MYGSGKAGRNAGGTVQGGSQPRTKGGAQIARKRCSSQVNSRGMEKQKACGIQPPDVGRVRR